MTLKKLLTYPLLFLAALLAVSCSGSREFRIDVASDDIGTQNVRLLYYTGGSYRNENVTAIDGKFSVKGSLDSPAFIEVYTATGSLLGVLIVEGGDHVEARLSALNPENISVKGNDDAEELASFLADNRELIQKNDFDAVNRNIEAYVRKNPGDFVSVVLMARYFRTDGYEPLAAELLRLIPAKLMENGYATGLEQMLSASLAADSATITTVRGFSRGDTAAVFSTSRTPYSVVMLTDDKSRGADSIRSVLSVLRGGSPASRLAIADLGCDRDTMLWKASLRNLPADYPAGVERLWLVGGMADGAVSPAAPADIPYFMLTDSAGRIIYRGSSATALRAAYGRLKK